MFKEFSQSIKANLYERVSSPLIGSVAISWLIFNWKAIFYLIYSDAKIEEKLLVFSFQYADICLNFIYPLALGFLTSIAYPIAAFVPFYLWESIQHRQRVIKRRLSMSELLTLEQSLELKKELASKDKEIKNIISANQIAEEALKNKINELTRDNADLYYRLSELTPPTQVPDSKNLEISDLEYKILDAHTGMESGHIQISSDIASRLNVDVKIIKNALRGLIERKLIKTDSEAEDDNGNSVPGFSLTQLGREYLAHKKSLGVQKR